MFTYPKLDLTIARHVDVSRLRWPGPGEVGDEAAPGCNRQYADLRRLQWSEVKRVLEEEGELVGRMERADDPCTEYEAIEEESCEGEIDLLGLDLGVASSVVALSAARCVPFTSCNAGVFGGDHLEAYPVVAFFCKAPLIQLLLDVAASANVGLENHGDGSVLLYADDIRKLRRFAAGLFERRTDINRIRLSVPRRRRPRLAQ